MGCTQSKIENEEAVARCKERKQYMKEAVSARNGFAAAHSSYAMDLKNTGAALSDYAQGEVQNPLLGPQSIPLPTPPVAPTKFVETLPPPPPPPSNYTTAPLQRAATMPPEIQIPEPEPEPKPKPKPKPKTIEEEDEDEIENEGSSSLRRRRSSRRGSGGGGVREVDEAPPPPPQPQENRTTPNTASFQQQETYDYFFNMDNMPGPTLSGIEEVNISKEEMNRNGFGERPKIIEEEEEEEEEEVRSSSSKVAVEPVAAVVVEEAPPRPPPAPEAAAVVAGRSLKKGKQVGSGSGEGKGNVKKNVNLVQIFAELDDHFLKASESAHEVSKMLEATRLHYHSNFADNRGHIDHSARVMRVITWNRSFKGLQNPDDVKDDFDKEENETHASVLDKLLAWEKKLYDEVKVGEIMKFEYQRKVNSLNKLKKRGSNSDALEKAKAAVSHLHTRYIVDIQSMDSTVSEINRLRDEQLYPKLVQLVDGMATMWGTMQSHHQKQSKIVQDLKYLDISQSPKETTEHHHSRTEQLHAVLRDWHAQFEKLVDRQKDYIKALNAWLKLNLIPTESSLKEKVSSPPRPQNPPILRLLHVWQDNLEKLPDELARSAIKNFAALIDTILHLQEEEIRLREKCEDIRRDLARKNRAFEEWRSKHIERIPDEVDPDRMENNPNKDLLVERQVAVDLLRNKLEQEEEVYQRLCLQVREKSINSLRTQLPSIFEALSQFSVACSEMYRNLKSRAHPRG